MLAWIRQWLLYYGNLWDWGGSPFERHHEQPRGRVTITEYWD